MIHYHDAFHPERLRRIARTAWLPVSVLSKRLTMLPNVKKRRGAE